MMLALLNFPTLVARMASAVQGASATLINLTIGSVLRAFLEGVASVGLWLQWLIVLVLARTRAATSNGPDLDTWMADYSLTRLPAIPATGLVSLIRFTATTSATVLTTATVRTSDGSRTFQITEDDTNTYWNVGLHAYLIPIGVTSAAIPVTCVTAGTSGNVQANTITLLGSAMPGIDTCNNAAAFTNGADPETDAAFRARFILFLAGLARGTLTAVESAIAGVQEGLTYAIAVNQDAAGNYMPGNFVVTVDDGSGAPSTTLLNAVSAAINSYRALTETFNVLAPSVTHATIVFTLIVPSGASHSTYAALVTTAITKFVNALGVGVSLPYFSLPGIALAVCPPGSTIEAPYTINGGTSDLIAGSRGVIRIGSVTVN